MVNMMHKRAWVVAFAAIAVLIGASLFIHTVASSSQSPTAGSGIPEWQFRWLPAAGDIAASVGPQAAFASAGRAEHLGPGGVDATEHAPAAVIWLATGRTFGEAVVQLGPAGHYWNLVTLLIDAKSQTWQALAGDLPQATPCGAGTPFSAPYAVFGAWCTIEPARSGTTPVISSALWTTPQSDIFSIDRIAAAALRPMSGTESLTLADDPGWIFQDKGWTVIVVALPSGDSIIFASTADAQRCREIVTDFLRLGVDPASIK